MRPPALCLAKRGIWKALSRETGREGEEGMERKGTNQDKEKKKKMYVGETEIKRSVKETMGDLLS